MSAFREQLVNDLDVFFNVDEFAQEVVYINAAKTIKAIVTPLADPEIKTTGSAARAEVVIKRLDIPTPKPMDEISIDGQVWIVELATQADEYTHYLRVRSKEGVVYA